MEMCDMLWRVCISSMHKVEMAGTNDGGKSVRSKENLIVIFLNRFKYGSKDFCDDWKFCCQQNYEIP